MRFQLSNQRGDTRVLEIISRIPRPWRGKGGEGAQPEAWNDVPGLSELQLWDNGLMRVLYVPTGMAEDEAQRVVNL
jgi:hypothetical protein